MHHGNGGRFHLINIIDVIIVSKSVQDSNQLLHFQGNEQLIYREQNT